MQNGKFLLVCWVEYYTLVFCGNTIFSSEVEAFSLSLCLSLYMCIYMCLNIDLQVHHYLIKLYEISVNVQFLL